jgi:hypothetical protein
VIYGRDMKLRRAGKLESEITELQKERVSAE